MIPLPDWIKEIFDQGHCPHCQKGLKKKGVFGLGIREEKVKKKKVYSFCYEYQCPSCKERTVFTGFPTTFEDFIGDMLDIASSLPNSNLKDITDALNEADELLEEPSEDGMNEAPFDVDGASEPVPPKKKKSGMSDREAKDAIRLVQETEFYEDLLDKLGIKKLEREPREDESK